MLSGREDPLTFGDLAADGIDLRMVTTCLSQGSPYEMPWNARSFFFDENTWRKLFPDEIVDWLWRHPPARPEYGSPKHERGRTYAPSGQRNPVAACVSVRVDCPEIRRRCARWFWIRRSRRSPHLEVGGRRLLQLNLHPSRGEQIGPGRDQHISCDVRQQQELGSGDSRRRGPSRSRCQSKAPNKNKFSITSSPAPNATTTRAGHAKARQPRTR
jgi:hypothetical protein